MAVIRSIERHNAHSYAVTGDGQPPVIVGMESIAEHGLEIGRQLTEAHWAAIHRTARHRFAIARALRLIGRRARTRDELCRELSRSFTGPEVESALTRLVELGYLDDQSWAQDYVARSRGRGRSLLAHELSRRGIAREVREQALAEHDDRYQALAAARQRLRLLRHLTPAKRDQRLYAFLCRRGFDPETARAAMAQVTDSTTPRD